MKQNIQRKMSSFLRTIPNKFTSFVNTRRQVTNIKYQLPNHDKSSLFLEEFLGRQTAVNSTINYKPKHLNSVALLLNRNVPVAYVNNIIKRPKALNKKYNGTKHQIMKLQQQRQTNVQTLYVVVPDVTNINLLSKNTRWEQSLTNSENKGPKISGIGKIPSAKRILDNVSPNREKDSILCSAISQNVQNVNEIQPSEDGKPPNAQLQTVFDVLREDLPLLFITQMNYTIYTPDLIFVNNFRGKTTVGIYPYFSQIMWLKLIGHLKFAYVKLNILKMTMHPEDNTIKVRWRIVGISGTRIFLTFWKFKIWNVREQIDNTSAWYDGFSTFYVNNDGKIFKHIVDKMMPDQEVQAKIKKLPITTKLALFAPLLDINLHYVKFYLKKYLQLLRIK
ncbi:uncharacterized protein LOC143426436 [Xylocopa sonorina]|uniref:uncharacterized protein LOC143426436 n=1 Tax=Xylocopa sonorina TaxID=1818115 RepID=UPI00403B3854